VRRSICAWSRSHYARLDEWIERETIPFSVDASEAFNAAVDRMMGSLGDSVDLLGLGEALHGGEDTLSSATGSSDVWWRARL